jgi:hypothetical protein
VKTLASSPTTESQNLAKRFRDYGEAYFRFITTPGIESTNNVVEQAIRFVVIDRVVTQGTRGETGRIWSQRIWMVLATCSRQGRSAFNLILKAIKAYFNVPKYLLYYQCPRERLPQNLLFRQCGAILAYAIITAWCTRGCKPFLIPVSKVLKTPFFWLIRQPDLLWISTTITFSSDLSSRI